METILTTHNLSKLYKSHFAVQDVNMHINRGDIYGFVGENGSGKTTVIRLISGLIRPHSGEFELFGVKNNSPQINFARRKIGAVVETPSIYRNMSAYDNLKTQSILLGCKDESKILSVLREVGLEELYHDPKKAANFSLGMRQRLGIAMALIGDPEFLLLDEPMNGLDPAGIVEIRELILKLNRERKITFLISSHILSELSLVANKYGIISKGVMVKEITAEQLREECSKTTTITVDRPEELSALLADYADTYRIQNADGGVRIIGEIDLNEVLSAVIQSGLRLLRVNCSETSFEDYYLSLIGGDKRA